MKMKSGHKPGVSGNPDPARAIHGLTKVHKNAKKKPAPTNVTGTGLNNDRGTGAQNDDGITGANTYAPPLGSGDPGA